MHTNFIACGNTNECTGHRKQRFNLIIQEIKQANYRGRHLELMFFLVVKLINLPYVKHLIFSFFRILLKWKKSMHES